jgi:hypothetical protein
VASKVVGDAKQATTCGGWIEVAGVVGSEDERTGWEGLGSGRPEGVEKLKKGERKKANEVEPEGANFHGTVGPGFSRVRTS